MRPAAVGFNESALGRPKRKKPKKLGNAAANQISRATSR